MSMGGCHGCIHYPSSSFLGSSSEFVALSAVSSPSSIALYLWLQLSSPLSNEQPAPGHITPTDKMPPLLSLSHRASLVSPSLPPSLSLFPDALAGSLPPPFLAHLPRRLRIGVSPRASSRQRASQKVRLSTKAHLPVLHPCIPDFHIKGNGSKRAKRIVGSEFRPPLPHRSPHASCCRPPPIIEIPPALPLSADRLCLRFTHEITRHDRVGIRPAAGQAVGVGRRERNMCLQKEDISFGDVYRLLPASDGRTRTAPAHEYCPRPTRLRLGSCSCVQSKRKSWLSFPPSLTPTIHSSGQLALLAPSTMHRLHPPNCSPFPPSSPFSNFHLASFRPSIRPRPSPSRLPPAQTRLTLGRFPVCLPLKRPHSLAHSLTHSLTPDSRHRCRSPSSPCCNYIHFFSHPRPAPLGPGPSSFLEAHRRARSDFWFYMGLQSREGRGKGSTLAACFMRMRIEG